MTAKLSKKAEAAVDNMVAELQRAIKRENDYCDEAESVFHELQNTCEGMAKMTHTFEEIQEMEVEIQSSYTRIHSFNTAIAIIKNCWRDI
jgi:hypothetical protein